jgi:transcriptional regulator with XRE-family HTH domain
VTPLRLQEVRKKARLSQSELSKLSGVKLRTIQEYEYGRQKLDTAKIAILAALADALQVPLYELLEDRELADKVKANTKREV